MAFGTSACKQGVPIVILQYFIILDVFWFPQFSGFKILALGRDYPRRMEGTDEKVAMGIKATTIAVLRFCHKVYLSKSSWGR